VSELPDVWLRPLVLTDATLLEAAYDAEVDPYNWAGFRDPGWVAASLAERRTLRDDAGQLAVVDDEDTLLGDVGFHRAATGPAAASWCWQIGITLLPPHRGKGYGSAAQRALAVYLFSTTTAHRVEADTDLGNVAEHRALDRAGFTREGVRRGYQWRDGSWHDTVLYAVLRGEL
jgi:RimJ/RimL family protein N-acetyltransferase